MSTISSSTPVSSPVPALFRALVDDAAIFPPGDAPLAAAVAAHRGHRAASYAALVGPFVVSDVRLPDLIEIVRAEQRGQTGQSEASTTPLAVAVVVTGGAGAIEPAVRWAGGADELDLRGVELALRDEDDLAHNARRVTTALDQLTADGHLDEDTTVYLEPPRIADASPSHSWLAALDEIAAADLRLKFRTGGVTPDAFPDERELATCIGAALDRELAFKCTAGLHHAVRHATTTPGSEPPATAHGFLNVLLATRASLDGEDVDAVADVLALGDAEQLTARVRESGNGVLVPTRDWFTSFGSCSVRDPLTDLADLGLLSDTVTDLPEEPA